MGSMNYRALLLGALLVHALTQAQEFGTVDAAVGTTTATTADGKATVVTVGQKIQVGQTLQTQSGAELHVATVDGGFVALRPNSLFKVQQYNPDKGAGGAVEMSLIKGALRSITGWIGKLNPSGYRLVTPTATVGIRGTDHETTVLEVATGRDQPGTYDSVAEGATTVRTPHGETAVRAGQHAYAARDARVAPRVLAARPGFLAGRRALRLEHRIAARKQHLAQHVQRTIERHRAALAPGQRPLKEELRERREGEEDHHEPAQPHPRRGHRGALHR